MQIKTAVVFGALCAGVVVSAPTHRNECTPLYKGELEYQADWAGGRTGHETGKVQYKDGKLEIGIDAKKGATVVYERCGQRKYYDELGAYGRLVLEDKKCLVRDGNELRAGKCNKKAEFVYSTDISNGMQLQVENRYWNRKKNKELELRKENEDTQTTRMYLSGRTGVPSGKCSTLFQEVRLGTWLHGEKRAWMGIEDNKVGLKKKATKVTLEACNKEGHEGFGGRVRVGKKCLSVNRNGKNAAELAKCAEGGEELEKQWFFLGDGVYPVDAKGDTMNWSWNGKELRTSTDADLGLSVYSSS